MSIFKKIAKGALGVVAPVLSTALPGPMGPMAKNILTGVLGLDSEANEHEIEKALATADPALLQKLKEADQKFKLDMKALDVDLSKLDVEDRKDARSMHVEMRDWTPTVLGGTAVAGWVGLVYFLTQNNIPAGNENLMYALVGILSTVMVQVFNFYFGSSDSSAKKNDIIHKLKNGGK